MRFTLDNILPTTYVGKPPAHERDEEGQHKAPNEAEEGRLLGEVLEPEFLTSAENKVLAPSSTHDVSHNTQQYLLRPESRTVHPRQQKATQVNPPIHHQIKHCQYRRDVINVSQKRAERCNSPRKPYGTLRILEFNVSRLFRCHGRVPVTLIHTRRFAQSQPQQGTVTLGQRRVTLLPLLSRQKL